MSTSITSEVVIASKARQGEGREAKAADDAKLPGAIADNVTLIARAEKEGRELAGVVLHKPIQVHTGGGAGSDVVLDTWSKGSGGARDKGQWAFYQLVDHVIIWHKGARLARDVWPSNVAATVPMGGMP